MKNYIYLFAIAALSLAACSKTENDIPEENPGNVPAVTGRTITFTCEYPASEATPVEEAPTGVKTTINNDGSVFWEANDSITVYYLHDGVPKDVTAKAISDGTSSSCTFTATLPDGHEPDHFWAAYPAKRGTLSNEGGNEQFSLTLGETDGSFKAANLMAAYTTKDAMTFAFKNAVGIVRVALPAGGVISHAGTNYTITKIRIKGKETSIRSRGDAVVNVSNDAVSGYTYPTSSGAQNAQVALTNNVRSSGYAYIASYPGDLTNGFAVRYFSAERNIPAVLTKDKTVTITAGNIKPLSDLTSRIVWDYYVSASGIGNGLTAEEPMSITDMENLLTHNGAASVITCYSNQVNGATFHFTAGTHNIASPISIPPKSLYSESTYYTITGDNAATLDGGGASRIFEITGDNERVTISDMTLTNGSGTLSGGLVSISAKSPVFEHVTFSNTASSSPGGAVRIDTANSGSGTFNNCTFSENSTEENGGAFVITNSGTAAEFTGCTFTGNTAAKSGGAIYATNGNTVFKNCTITDNIAATSGGAIYTTAGTLTLENCTIGTEGHGNSAENGGAIYSTNGTIKINGGSVSYNSATTQAGGIYSLSTNNSHYSPTFYINNCSFIDNTAPTNGCVIYCNNTAASYASKLCINNSYFYISATLNTQSKNQSLVCNKGKTILMNSTIVGTLGNRAWGAFALGAHINHNDPNGCLLINSIIKNKASQYQTATYETGGNYYAVIKDCLTRVVHNSSSGYESQIIQDNVASDATISFSGYAWNGTVPEGFTKKTAQQIQDELLSENAGTPVYSLATDFFTWLESLTYDVAGTTYNAFQVDINGTPRSGAYWPGCYQN